MDLEEGMPLKIGASVATVALFIVGMAWIGVRYNDGGLGSTGGLALVVALALFVVAMAAVGLAIGD